MPIFEDMASVGFATEGVSLDTINDVSEILDASKSSIGDDPTGSQPEKKEEEEDKKKTNDEDENKEEEKKSEEDDKSDEDKEKEEEEKSKTDDKKSEEDKDLPFHKHPRWKEMRKENRELREQISSFDDKFKQLEAKLESSKSNDDDEALPADFVEKFGHDFETWEKVKDKWTKPEPKKQEEEKIDEERIRNYEKKIEQTIKDIEDDYDVDLTSETGKKTKNEFFAFMKEFQPTTGGKLDFTKGWKLFDKQRSTVTEEDKHIEAKKNVAKNISSKSTSKKDDKPINFRKVSWDDL